MATLPSLLSDVTQQFTSLQSKLDKLTPSLSSTIKVLTKATDELDKLASEAKNAAGSLAKLTAGLGQLTSTLTQGLDSLTLGAGRATGGLEKASAGLDKLAESASSLDKLTDKAKELDSTSKKSSTLLPSILSQVGTYFKGLPGRATADKVSDATEKFGKPAEAYTSLKESLDTRIKKAAPKDDGTPGDGPKVPDSFGAAMASVERFDTILEATKVSLLTGLAPALGVAADMFASILGWVQPLVETMSHYESTIQVVASFLVPLVGTLFAFAKAIELVALATEIWEAYQTLLNVAMISNPVGALVVGVLALIAALAYAYTHFAKFRGMVEGIIAVVAAGWTYLTDLFDYIGLVIQRLQHPFSAAGTELAASLDKAAAKVKNFPQIKAIYDSASEAASKKMTEEQASEKGARLKKEEEDQQAKVLKAAKAAASASSSVPTVGSQVSSVSSGRVTRATATHITFNIENLGATTFNVESLDKKHAVAMREHVREALVAALQDATAPSPALA
jgi:hypothetical protein